MFYALPNWRNHFLLQKEVWRILCLCAGKLTQSTSRGFTHLGYVSPNWRIQVMLKKDVWHILCLCACKLTQTTSGSERGLTHICRFYALSNWRWKRFKMTHLASMRNEIDEIQLLLRKVGLDSRRKILKIWSIPRKIFEIVFNGDHENLPQAFGGSR